MDHSEAPFLLHNPSCLRSTFGIFVLKLLSTDISRLFYIPYHLSTYPHILLDVKYGVHEGRWLPSTQRRPSFRLPIRHCFSALSPVFPAAMPSQFHNATVYGSCFSPCWSQFLELADSANMSLRHPTGTPSSRPLSIYRLSSVHRSYCIGAHRPDLCCRSRPGACGEGNHRIH